MVDQNNSLQIIIWLVSAFGSAALADYLVYRYFMRKHGNRRRALDISGLVSPIPLAIILGMGFGASLPTIIFGVTILLIISILYTKIIWRARDKLYGKDRQL